MSVNEFYGHFAVLYGLSLISLYSSLECIQLHHLEVVKQTYQTDSLVLWWGAVLC
jgi:hypothetical protein